MKESVYFIWWPHESNRDGYMDDGAPSITGPYTDEKAKKIILEAPAGRMRRTLLLRVEAAGVLDGLDVIS